MSQELPQLALNISTLAIIAFSVNLLLLRAFERQAYLPLAMCLLSVGIVSAQPTLAAFFPTMQPFVLILSLPALLLIAPSFWYYVQGVTYDKPWKFSDVARRDFILFAIGAIIAFIALVIPADIRNALLVDGNEQILEHTTPLFRNFMYGVLITTFALVVGWTVQSGYYFYKIIKRLHHYRQQLKNVFASTDAKEIRWLSWLLLAIGIVWLATAITLMMENVSSPVQWPGLTADVILLVMIWIMAIWGLRQKPGLEELYDDPANESHQYLNAPVPNGSTQEKYARSALSNEHAVTIAKKIEQAMHQDKLYMDASLSLPKLAKHISTSANYISQTLNEQLESNFFDYVNQFRIAQAKQLLIETDDNVLNIAMNVGFNAKSSFYNAFKKETQLTPSQFRKQHTKV